MDMAMINLTNYQMPQLWWMILTGKKLRCRPGDHMSEIEAFIPIITQIFPKWSLSWISHNNGLKHLCSCLWESAKHMRVHSNATPHILAYNLFYTNSAWVISVDLTDSSVLGQTQGSLRRRRTETKLGTFSKTLASRVDNCLYSKCDTPCSSLRTLVDEWFPDPVPNFRPGHANGKDYI